MWMEDLMSFVTLPKCYNRYKLEVGLRWYQLLSEPTVCLYKTPATDLQLGQWQSINTAVNCSVNFYLSSWGPTPPVSPCDTLLPFWSLIWIYSSLRFCFSSSILAAAVWISFKFGPPIFFSVLTLWTAFNVLYKCHELIHLLNFFLSLFHRGVRLCIFLQPGAELTLHFWCYWAST